MAAGLLSGCGEAGSFTVTGSIKPSGTYGLKVYYYSGSAMQSVPSAARNGRFAFEGRSSKPTIVDILSAEGRVLCQFVARNGQEIDVSIDLAKPYRVSISGGDAVNGRWASWLKDNAAALEKGDSRAINALIERYVKAHRDDMLSTCLMVTLYDWSYDPRAALRLLDSIEADARPSSLTDGVRLLVSRIGAARPVATLPAIRYTATDDSLRTWKPSAASEGGRTLLAVTNDKGALPDSVRQALRRLPAHPRGAVLELSVDADTTGWRRGVSRDSLTWTRGWLPGGIEAGAISALALPQAPYYIVGDAAGRILLRTPSVSQAVRRYSAP